MPYQSLHLAQTCSPVLKRVLFAPFLNSLWAVSSLIISTSLANLIGSGKTAAFLVPVLSKLFGKALKLKAPRPKPGMERGYQAQPLVLILGPTRELVWQIFDEARKFCYRSMLRPW
jgi:hypothetical protein